MIGLKIELIYNLIEYNLIIQAKTLFWVKKYIFLIYK